MKDTVTTNTIFAFRNYLVYLKSIFYQADGGVMVGEVSLSADEFQFVPRSCQAKSYTFGIWCF